MTLSPAALKGVLLSAMLQMLANGTQKATAGDIAGYADVGLTPVETGRLLMGMRVPNRLTSGQKFYVLDPAKLNEIQLELVDDVPEILLSIPDMDPGIAQLKKAVDWLHSQVLTERQYAADKALYSKELRTLEAARNKDEAQYLLSYGDTRLHQVKELVSRHRQEATALVASEAELASLPDAAETARQLADARAALADRQEAAKTALKESQEALNQLNATERATGVNVQEIIHRNQWIELKAKYGAERIAEALQKLDAPEPKPWWFRFLP